MDLPAPLALPRIHRLLRPLRTSLSTLLTSLTLAESRPLPAPARDLNGKSKAVDLDYGSVPPRLKRPPTTTTSSSPFQHKAKRHKTSARYGGSSRRPERKEPRVRAESRPIDLARVGMGVESVGKVGHLVRAYRNCLECAYGVDRRASGGEQPKRTGVVSLVESCARRVGEGVEDAVGAAVGDDEGAERSAFEDDEDQARLVDEWYEAVPPYARSWMLGHHATAIVLNGLERVSLPVLLALVEVCSSVTATAEAALFYEPVLALALSCAPSSLPATASHVVPLAHLAGAPPAFFTALRSTLLSSTFSERLFFAEFVDLARTPLYNDDAPTLAQVLVVLTEVARSMLDAIDALEDDDSTERLSEQVGRRLESQLERALPVLLSQPDTLGEVTAVLDSFLCAWPSPRTSSLVTTLHLASGATSGVLDSLGPAPLSPPHLAALLSSLSTQSLLTLSKLLHSSAAHALERQLLESALERYDDLVDVRSTKGHQVFSRDTFSRLLELRGPAPAPDPESEDDTPPPKTPAKDPRQPSEPLAHSSLGRPFRIVKTPLPTRARKAVVYAEPEDGSDAESQSDGSDGHERESELAAESEMEMEAESPRVETDSDGGTVLGDLSSDEDDDPTPQPCTPKPTEVIDLSLDSDSEPEHEFSKRVLPRSTLRPPPTSEPDALDLLASARRAPVRWVGQARGRRKRVSASSDELGM